MSKKKVAVAEPKIEGVYFTLWFNPSVHEIPQPSETPFEDKEVFLKKLEVVRKAAIDAKGYARIRGLSCCHICRVSMALEEYLYKGWLWSGRYIHAVAVHNFVPSAEFVEFINTEFEEVK